MIRMVPKPPTFDWLINCYRYLRLPAHISELLHELHLVAEVQLLHVGHILGDQGQLQGGGYTCVSTQNR